MLNEFLSVYAFGKLVKKDYSHLKDNLTKEQFQEIKLLFIDRKAKKEYYKDLYIDSFK